MTNSHLTTPATTPTNIIESFKSYFSHFGSFHYMLLSVFIYSLERLCKTVEEKGDFLRSIKIFFDLAKSCPKETLELIISRNEQLLILWANIQDKEFTDLSLEFLGSPDLRSHLSDPFYQILGLPVTESDRDELLAQHVLAAEQAVHIFFICDNALPPTRIEENSSLVIENMANWIINIIKTQVPKRNNTDKILNSFLKPLLANLTDITDRLLTELRHQCALLLNPDFDPEANTIAIKSRNPLRNITEAAEDAKTNQRFSQYAERVYDLFEKFLDHLEKTFLPESLCFYRAIIFFITGDKKELGSFLNKSNKDRRAFLLERGKKLDEHKLAHSHDPASPYSTASFITKRREHYKQMLELLTLARPSLNQARYCIKLLNQLSYSAKPTTKKTRDSSLPEKTTETSKYPSEFTSTVSLEEFVRRMLAYAPQNLKTTPLLQALKECSFTQPVNRAHFERGLDHLQAMAVILESREPTKHNLILTAITAQWALEEATVAFMGERAFASTEEGLTRFKTHDLTQLTESDFLAQMTKIEQHLRRPSETKNEGLIGRIIRAEEVEELQQEIAMETYRAFAQFAKVKWDGKAPQVKSISEAEPLSDMEPLVNELSDRGNEDICHHIESMRCELRSFNPKDAQQMALFNTVMRRAIYLIIELQLQEKGGRTNYETLVERAGIDFGDDKELERFVKEAHQDFFAIRYGIYSSRAGVRSSAQVARTGGELHRQEDSPDGFEVAISRSTQRRVGQQDAILEEVKRNLEFLLKFSRIMEGLL